MGPHGEEVRWGAKVHTVKTVPSVILCMYKGLFALGNDDKVDLQ